MSAKTNPKRPSQSNNKVVQTHSGKTLKVNRSLGGRWQAMKEAKARRKVDRLQGLPKSRIKRLFWRLHPKRLIKFWFSRDGLIMGLKIMGITIMILFLFLLGVFAYFRKDLPKITDISGDNLGGTMSYYDRTGKILLWQDYNAVKRIPVQSSDISQYIKDATVATEDRNFYNERGFDVKAIARATINDVFHRGYRQGGSTITQQLVKLSNDWTQNRTFNRKVKELILAVELERAYTKDQILTGYLNLAPYGGIDFGVQAAAADYFHTSAKNLTLAQAAMLAAIPKSPSVYSPYDKAYFDKQAFLDRYSYVLDSMVETGKITQAQADKAKKVDVLAQVHPIQDAFAGIRAPYFVLAARDEVRQRFYPSDANGSAKIGGWKITTTLDMNLQKLAEQKVQAGMPVVRANGGDEAAFVAEDVKTGQMVAEVGGVDFYDKDHGKVNYATQKLPPGSSFKIYDYSTLIENSTNVGAGSVLYDVTQKLPGYPCTGGDTCLHDFDRRSPGAETLRYALGGSRNIPAVKAFLIAGGDKVIKTAEAMGLKSGYNCYGSADLSDNSKVACGPSAAIGDGAYLRLDEHVNGFATLSRMGQYIPRTYILKINDSSGKELKIEQPKPEQVIRPDTAYIVTDMISDPRASYFPYYGKPQVYKGWKFGIKTGTTNDAKDGWMMGVSTKYAAGVWVGYHNRHYALSPPMENLTEPILKGWMDTAHDSLKPVNWQRPSDIKVLPAYVVRNHIGYGSQEPSPSTDLFPSWYVPRSLGNSQTTVIDKVSGKLATDCTPPLAKQYSGGYYSPNQFSVDIFYGRPANPGGNITATDDVHSCTDQPPSINSFFVNNRDMSNGGSVSCDVSCPITTTVSAGTHPFDDPNYPTYKGVVNLLVNGRVVKSKQVTASPSTVSFSYGGSGTVTIAIQVVDSVLYDSKSSNASVHFSSSTAPLTLDSAEAGSVNTSFVWSGGSGTYSVYRTDDSGTPLCQSTGSSCSVARFRAPPGTEVYVKDSNGHTSDTKKVKGVEGNNH